MGIGVNVDFKRRLKNLLGSQKSGKAIFSESALSKP